MPNDIMKVSKRDIVSVDEYSRKLADQNRKIALLRKKQLYANLKSATEMRINTARKIQEWTQILSDKIFSPEAMEKLDVSRAIQLFKYVNNINLKVLADSNRLEEILGKYLQAGLLDNVDDNGEVKTATNDDIKNEVLSKLRKLVELGNGDDVIDAETVNDESSKQDSEKTTDKDIERLDCIDKSIDDNVDDDLPNPYDEEDEYDDEEVDIKGLRKLAPFRVADRQTLLT